MLSSFGYRRFKLLSPTPGYKPWRYGGTNVEMPMVNTWMSVCLLSTAQWSYKHPGRNKVLNVSVCASFIPWNLLAPNNENYFQQLDFICVVHEDVLHYCGFIILMSLHYNIPVPHILLYWDRIKALLTSWLYPYIWKNQVLSFIVKQERQRKRFFLKLYEPCIILQYVYKPTRCTKFCD